MCKCLFLIGWAGFLRQGLFRRRFFSWPHNKMQGSRCSQGVLRNSCSDSFNKRKLKKTFGKCFRKYSFFNFFWKTLRNNGNLQITRPQFLKRPNSWIYREFQNSFFLAHPRVVFSGGNFICHQGIPCKILGGLVSTTTSVSIQIIYMSARVTDNGTLIVQPFDCCNRLQSNWNWTC